MKEKEAFQPNIWHILAYACLIYAPFSFSINLICGLSITTASLLKLWASALIYALSFFIALAIVFGKKTKLKNNIIKYSVTLYTLLSFVLSIYFVLFEDLSIWSVYSFILLAVYSIITSLLLSYAKIKNFLISTLIYYAVGVTAFLILTTVIADHGQGNGTMILFGAFSIVYTVISIIYFFVKRSFAQIENEEKDYKPQFD